MAPFCFPTGSWENTAYKVLEETPKTDYKRTFAKCLPYLITTYSDSCLKCNRPSSWSLYFAMWGPEKEAEHPVAQRSGLLHVLNLPQQCLGALEEPNLDGH